MKRNYLSRLLLLTTTIVILSLAGCQSSKDKESKPKTEASDTSEDDAAPSQEEKDKDTKSPAQEEDIVQTPLEDIQGEGTSGNEMPDLENVEFAPLESPCVFTSESGSDLVSLTINSITFTDQRSQNDTTKAEAVVIVDYSYENIGSEDPILYGDVNFQLIQEDSVCTPYYLPDLTMPEPASKGAGANGQIAFAVSKNATEIILSFSDERLGEKVAFTTEIKK